MKAIIVYFTTELYNKGAISAFDNRFICVSAKKARLSQYNIKIYHKTKVKKTDDALDRFYSY